MRIYSITSVTMDFLHDLYVIDEPQLFTSEKEARDAVEDLKSHEIDTRGGAENKKREVFADSVGTNGVDCDYAIDSHSGRMLVIKLRMFDIEDKGH